MKSLTGISQGFKQVYKNYITEQLFLSIQF